MSFSHYTRDAVQLLQSLIQTPSLSEEEAEAADIMERFLGSKSVRTERFLNNVWASNICFDTGKPTVLLNSHLDTVPPTSAYTRNPFLAEVEGDRLYGLGSNDAGGCLVSLAMTFLHFHTRRDLPFNLIFAATAEEENSGPNGLAVILEKLPRLDMAIIGEPTEMNVAIAERGLLVLEAETHSPSGHAARYAGNNAIDKAIEDINKIKDFQFERCSSQLGPIKMSVNVIQGGQRHNLIPTTCRYLIDIRLTEVYSAQEIIDLLQDSLHAHLDIRSLRNCPPFTAENHPLVQAAVRSGGRPYVSPTTSDRALLTIPSIKMSPGVSERSHSADEFIAISEIDQGIQQFIDMFEGYR